MRGFGIRLGLAVICIGGAVATAQADPACIAASKATYKACKQQCSDDYKDDKFRCRNVLPACGNACLAGREVCLEPINAILDSCLDGCKATLQADKQSQCGVPPSCDQHADPVACDACVDPLQVAAFVCRDNCRESFRANHTEDVKQCRAIFRACVHACPPAS